MKTSQFFFKTIKDTKQDSEVISNELLEKAGYIKKVSKGLFIYTPLMWKVIKKFLIIVREELDKIGGQELVFPLLQPAELWKQTGRWEEFSQEKLLYTIKDRENKDFCLSPTHEEMAVFFTSYYLTGYKQLPLHLYQIATKFRDEIRPRFGLIRTKELLMQDSYTFSTNEDEMNTQYELLKQAYTAILQRINLEFVLVEADGGKIGKGKSEEFQVLTEIGEDTILVCESYAVNVETALSIPPEFIYEKQFKPNSEEKTPNITSIKDLCRNFSVEPHNILKTLIYKLYFKNLVKFVALGIRGDRQINPTKVLSFFQATEIELAEESDLIKIKIIKGFAGPLNCPIEFYADFTAQPMTNFICAANKNDIHFINVNWERDLPLPEFHDFLLAEQGDICPLLPGKTYIEKKGIEVAHIFNLGDRYTKALNLTFQNDNSEACHPMMGTYGIGIGRILSAYIQKNYDEKGLVWPLAIAPFKIVIITASRDEDILTCAKQIYEDFSKNNFDPLFEDREKSFGFKLKDAELLGIPFKLIIGKSFKKGAIEIESRQGEKRIVPLKELNSWAQSHLS